MDRNPNPGGPGLASPAVDPGEVNQGVDVTLVLGIKLDVIHMEEVADGRPILEFVPIVTLVDDMTEGVRAYAEQ